MDTILRLLEGAYNILDGVSIRGDSCEAFAAARSNLRMAFEMLKQQNKEDKDG